jgi:flagellar hook assembly protein FlgD
VRLAVYDVNGRLVQVLQDGLVPAGEHAVRWNGTDREGLAAASGVYFCRLAVSGISLTKSMVLLK